jgi:hypothetical protein
MRILTARWSLASVNPSAAFYAFPAGRYDSDASKRIAVRGVISAPDGNFKLRK